VSKSETTSQEIARQVERSADTKHDTGHFNVESVDLDIDRARIDQSAAPGHEDQQLGQNPPLDTDFPPQTQWVTFLTLIVDRPVTSQRCRDGR
jgi:hypothetical protein